MFLGRNNAVYTLTVKWFAVSNTFCFEKSIFFYLLQKYSELYRFFSIITPVSHNSSEIILICWFVAQEAVLIIINAENSSAAEYETVIHFLQDSLMNRKFKRTAFF